MVWGGGGSREGVRNVRKPLPEQVPFSKVTIMKEKGFKNEL